METLWHRYLRRPYRLKKVIDRGSGPVNIVLIHGLASRSQIWQPLVDILESEKYRVRSFDLLGFGTSPKPGYSKYSTKEHARTIMHTLAKDSRRNESFILVGHSMGCLIAAYIAHRWPKKIGGIVLYKPPLLMSAAEKRSLHKQFYSYLSTRPAVLALWANFVGRFGGKLSGFNTEGEAWVPIENSLINTILAQETLQQLKAINVPVEIAYGRLDFVASKVKAKKLQEINPRIRLHYVVEGHDIKSKSGIRIKKLIENVQK